MTLVRFDQEPRITDSILLSVSTPGADGCLAANPYKLDSVVVYYVERDFFGQNYGSYDKTAANPGLQAELEAAQAELCADPTQDNATAVQRLQDELASKSQLNVFYYKDRVAVQTFGNPAFPAWLSTDPDNSAFAQDLDADGNPVVGRFSATWEPEGSIREGDYFLCWTWTPLAAGEQLSASTQFNIAGDPNAVTTIPTHVTADGKYDTLLERYLPEMYKFTLSDKDLTPAVLDNLNQAVAKGFTFLEDQANQIIDLFDANALHESLLVYLSNLFGLKLKSGDPTLWRRQIKEAVPLFKKKGTLPALEEAFAQAGMTLYKFTQYWQVVSPYTWVESFTVGDSYTFPLAKHSVLTPSDPSNSGLWLMPAGETEYQAVPTSYATFATAGDGTVKMTWVAENLSADPVALVQGDRVKVMYQYAAVPDGSAQQLENYVRSLPLADQRDESSQSFPLKNWNVRLIAEDDPLFAVLVPARHPFADPLVFGHLRTEFAYSENIYNMEEYNGSTRPSHAPCDIDKNFLDPCGGCLGGLYSVDIGVEELSNDRMLEAQEILREYVPFHAQAHSLNFTGEVNEFVQSPAETVDMLITVDHLQYVISGESNPIFTRMMQDGLGSLAINRQMLTDQITVLAGQAGVAYNDHVALITPDDDLEALGVDYDGHVLEVLAPSANAGTYSLEDAAGRTARVVSAVVEPVDESAFTFNLSNIPYGNSYSSITQDNLVVLADAAADFRTLGVKSLWDVEFTPGYAGGPWKVLIPAYSSQPYPVANVVNGTLILKDNGTLPGANAGPVSYQLLNDASGVVSASNSGAIQVTRRGLVDLNDLAIVDVREFASTGDYLYYNGVEYLVVEFNGNKFWVEGYAGGNVAGVHVQIRRHLVHAGVGYFGYRGLHLTTAANHESGFGMIDGNNPPPADQQADNSLFKENYLFLIGGEYYKIAAINGTAVVLSGRHQDWKTRAAGGTAVTYGLVHFPLKGVSVGFISFDGLNRNGKDPVIREIESSVDNSVAVVALSSSPSTPLEGHASQQEGISFTIETRGGDVFEGEI